MKKILVTGGAGFIGSHFIKFMLAHTDCFIINVDKLTYAGNLDNLSGIDSIYQNRYRFFKGDICDNQNVSEILKSEVDIVVNFAAESHVDRSIETPDLFAKTNIMGTLVLLQNAQKAWQSNLNEKLFIQISTDEVYGSLSEESPEMRFTEDSPINPSSPYSASKAAADMLAMSFYHTYRLPVIITRCSNNYGPNQYPEKLIPLMISNALQDKPLPVYGDGQNIRDWIYVEDNIKAINKILNKGIVGNVYNIGAENEIKNIDLVKQILDILNKPYSLIQYVEDRAGHDRRYAISASKLSSLTGWSAQANFTEKLKLTIEHYNK
ncbi:MAG: dTDP-glucose 4,6-dehydratase [bacterium]